MAVSAAQFQARNPHFDGRKPASIEGALAEAAGHFDAGVCGNLYDQLVEAQARVILLSDPSGMPTSVTGDKSGPLEQAVERLNALKRLVPIRGLGTRSD
jgi:hypothetical protein